MEKTYLVTKRQVVEFYTIIKATSKQEAIRCLKDWENYEIATDYGEITNMGSSTISDTYKAEITDLNVPEKVNLYRAKKGYI